MLIQKRVIKIVSGFDGEVALFVGFPNGYPFEKLRNCLQEF